MIPFLLLLTACQLPSGTPAPPAPSWLGGSVRAVPLDGGELVVLDTAWRSTTPLLSPGRVPAETTVALRRLDAAGAMRWETVLTEGARARALDLVARPEGGFVALVVAPGEPPVAGVLPVSASGVSGPMVPLGAAKDLQPRALHVDATGRLLVAGSTSVRPAGAVAGPEPDGEAGFIGVLDASLQLGTVELWDAPGQQSIDDLASHADGVTWTGTSRPRRGAPGTAVVGRLGSPTPTPIEGLVEARALEMLPDGVVVAGWAADGTGIRGLPGSTPLVPRVAALAPDGTVRWQTDGCCATWNHDLDLRLHGDTVLFGGRADAATLRLGGLEAPGGAGVQAFSARLDIGTGAVRSLQGLGMVGDTPLDLPVSILPGGCVVAAAGTPPLCPGTGADGG